MRIAIISAHYMPEIGYQEVHLAKAYARLNHEVKVFTSAASVKLGGSINQLKYRVGNTKDPKYGYDIIRLPSVSFKSKSLPKGLKKNVEQFKPDLIVILGVAKMFPYALLNKHVYNNTKVVSVYGDAKEYLDRGTFKQNLKSLIHDIGYKTIKYPLYKKALKYNHKLILNIPETEQLFHDFLNPKEKEVLQSKKVMLNLGYDPDEYYFNENDRHDLRAQLGINENEIVLITSTRINKRKNLEQIITLVDKLNAEGKNVSYILIGFLNDSYERELKDFISSLKSANKFKCFPFLSSKEIRKYYCAADAGIWLKAAISIQEAMGTGLPVILENKPSVNHLLSDGENGWYFNKENFNSIILKAVEQLEVKKTNRAHLSTENSKKLSYDAIAQKIIDSVM